MSCSALRSKRTIGRILAAGFLLFLPVMSDAVAKFPKKRSEWFGTYTADGSGNAETFNLEIGNQQGTESDKVSVFAMNLAELRGGWSLSKMGSRFKAVTRAEGGALAPKMTLDASVIADATVLQGTYALQRYFKDGNKIVKRPLVTGTFLVSR